MAFFNTIFGSKDPIPKENFPWVSLDRIEQVDQLVEESKTNFVLIFKHSTRCGISRFSLKNFESEFTPDRSKTSLYFLDILNHRDISNEIASRLDVIHQSPQVLLIKDSTAIYADSHGQINAEEIQQLIQGGVMFLN